MRKSQDEEVERLLSELSANEMVQQMRRYRQHGRESTYEHCQSVARLSYRIARKLHIQTDTQALVRGAMLHDFFLYDWHVRDADHRLHGLRHPDKAAENAVRCFAVSEKERQIIRCHMWPLTITKVPRSREGWIVCLADKCCCVAETLARR